MAFYVDTKLVGYELSCNIKRIMCLREGWASGVIFPIWYDLSLTGAPMWQHGLPLPFMLPAALYFLHPYVAIKLCIVLFYVLSAYTMYLYIYVNTGSKLAGGLAGLVYMLFPWRVMESFLWGNYGLSLFYVLFPLFLLCLENIHQRRYFLPAIVLYAAILCNYANYSHLALLFMSLIVTYSILRQVIMGQRDYLEIKRQLIIILCAVGLNAFFLMHVLFHPGLGQVVFSLDYQLNQNVLTHLKDIYLISLATYSPQLSDVLVLFLALGVVLTPAINKRLMPAYIFVLLLFFTLELRIPWMWQFMNEYVPLFTHVHYPDRFLGVFESILLPIMIGFSFNFFLLCRRPVRVCAVLIAIATLFSLCQNNIHILSEKFFLHKYQPVIPLNVFNKDGRTAIFRHLDAKLNTDEWFHDTYFSQLFLADNKEALFGSGLLRSPKQNLGLYLPYQPEWKIPVMGMMNTRYILTRVPLKGRAAQLVELLKEKDSPCEWEMDTTREFLLVKLPIEGRAAQLVELLKEKNSPDRWAPSVSVQVVRCRLINRLLKYTALLGEGLSLQPKNLIKHGSFENWSAGTDSAPDGWSVAIGDAAIARETGTGNSKIGTCSLKLSYGVTDTYLWPQSIGTDGSFAGKEVTFVCWIKTSVANQARIGISDGVTWTDSGYHTGGGCWELITVTKSMGAGTKALRARVFLGAPGDALFDDAIMAEGPPGPVVFARHKSEFFIYENKQYLPNVLLTKGLRYKMQNIRADAGDWLIEFPFDSVCFVDVPQERLYKTALPCAILPKETTLGSIRKDSFNKIMGKYDVLSEETGSINLKVESEEPAILVYTAANWLGWKATLDGEDTEIITANGSFIGIFVPPGVHTVSLWYGFTWFNKLGAFISLASLVFLLGLGSPKGVDVF